MSMWGNWKGTVFPLGLLFSVVWAPPSGISAQLTMTLLLRPLIRFIGLGSWQACLWDIIWTLISHSTGIFFISSCTPSTYHSAWDWGSVSKHLLNWRSWGGDSWRDSSCAWGWSWTLRVPGSGAVGSLTPSGRLRNLDGEGWDLERSGEWRCGLPPTESLLPALRPFQAANYSLWINSFVCASASSRVLAQSNIEKLEVDKAKVWVCLIEKWVIYYTFITLELNGL